MALDRSISLFVRKYLTTADERGITIPKKLRAEIEHHQKIVDTLDGYDPRGRDSARAMYDALIVGRDPFTDEDVRAALAAEQVTQLGLINRVNDTARGEFVNLIRRNIDELVAPFQPVYNAAGERLAAAWQTLTDNGIRNLDDTKAVASANLTVAQANLDARTALADLRTLWQAVSALLNVAERAVQTPLGLILARADAGDRPAYEITRITRGALEPWEVLENGLTISLATPTETQQRAERAQLLEQQRDAEALAYIREKPSMSAVKAARFNA